MKDYLPETDPELASWLETLAGGAAAHAVALGLSPAQVAELANAAAAFRQGLAAHVAAQAAAMAARERKDGARRAATQLARALAGRIQADHAIPDNLRGGLGLPVRDRTKTRLAPPTNVPLVVVETMMNGRLILRILQGGDPPVRRRPKGAIGAEVYGKLGEMPTRDADFEFVGLATRERFPIAFDGSTAGQPVFYRARWLDRRAQHGPWSPIVSTRVPG